MDKYELSIKEDKIKKHAEKKDYDAAVKIADTIDWSKVKNIKMLTLVSQVYEKAKNYAEAKNVLLFAYERVPMGRRMLYKLTELCVKGGNLEEAESYFEEFKKIAPNDIGKLLLAYQIEAARDGDLDQMITILELYRKNEFEEKWAYELAHLYHKAGRVKECVQLCNEIILWFSVGTYVDRALNLKMQYEPLTPSEQEKLVNKKKFEARVRAVEREFEKREYQGIREEEHEAVEKRREREQLEEAAMTNEPTEEVSFSEEVYGEEIFPVGEAVMEPEMLPAGEAVMELEALPAGEAVMEAEAFPVGEAVMEPEMFPAGEALMEPEAFPAQDAEPEPLFAEYAGPEAASGKVISFSSAKNLEEEVSAEAERMFFSGETLSEPEPLPVRKPEEEAAGESFADELFHIQADLAQAVMEAENVQPAFTEPEADSDGALLGQTKEVVEETRKALREGLKKTGAFKEEQSSFEEPEEPAASEEHSEGEAAFVTVPEEPAASKGYSGGKAEPEGVPEEASEAESASEEPEGPAAFGEYSEGGEASVSVPEEASEAEGPSREPEASENPEEPAPSEEPGPGTFSEAGQPAPEESVEEEDRKMFEITCVVVEAEPGTGRIPFAVEKLKKTHEVLGSSATQVAKISGEKLNAKGVHNTFKRLSGRDLIVDDAADLSHEAAAELVEELRRPAASLVLILVDSSGRIDEFLTANPELDQLCVYLEEGGQMDVDEFVDCANAYAKDEECVIEEMARLAIYAIAERLRNDGAELTEEAARKLVDEAIDRAEHRGIKGLFGSKYDKEGYLILKEQFFRN